jgi:integrase
MMDRRDALLLVERLKRRTRDSDVLTLCEYVHGTDVHGRAPDGARLRQGVSLRAHVPPPPDVFSGLWKDVESELGLGISFHSLRHTHASQLIAARRSHHRDRTPARARVTGNHASVYAHLFEKDNSKAAAAINAAFKGVNQ